MEGMVDDRHIDFRLVGLNGPSGLEDAQEVLEGLLITIPIEGE